jgi:hypothetical protein
MTPIHILFAKMFVKMFQMQLKVYTFATCFNLTGPSSTNILFQGIYRTAHIVTHILTYAVCHCIFIFGDIWCTLFLFFCIAAALFTTGHAVSWSCACCVGSVFWFT